MKTKRALLATASFPLSNKNSLRYFIQLALAGSLLATSGMATAVLRDHGPLNNVNAFPNWYRENTDVGGMALGQCIYTDTNANGPLCLTSTLDGDPSRFAGNFGEEAFFATADVIIPLANGGQLLWLGHLEMAYLTADGLPPAILDPSNSDGVVFSRERIRIDLPTDTACTGNYIVRTPFAVHNFSLTAGNRALFYTDDKTATPGNFTAALKGHTGPFLKWNVGQDGVNPVSAANPALTFTTSTGAVHKYIGDPAVPHTFIGSTIQAGIGHLDKVSNNYVEITPPIGCDLGAGAGIPLFEDQAAISGAIWDADIQDPISVSKSTYVRNTTTAALDVWVNGTKAHNIVLTAATDDAQHLPSTTMTEEVVNGQPTGKYHAHLEFDKTLPIPSQITATDLTSNPASRASSAVVDAVVVTGSTYNPVTKKLCITAHSGDQTSPIPLRLDAPAYGTFGPATATCPVVAATDVVLEKDLNDFLAPELRIPPEGILIKSNLGGSETSQPVSLTGVSDANLLPGAIPDTFANVPGVGTTTLDLTGESFGVAPGVTKTTASADSNLPASFRIVVISQPEIGTVTAPASGGNVTYTAQAGMPASTQTFYYAIQNTVSEAVTNVTRVDLSVNYVVPPPIGIADDQGVLRTSLGAIIPVLANDTTGLTNTAIDPASIQIVTAPGGGTATVNATGTITYKPVGQSGTANNTIDTFTYTVANVNGGRSAPITVRVVLKSAAEAIAFQRVRWSGSRWDIRFTSTYAGAAGAVTLAPTAQCVMSNNGAGGVNGNIGAPVSPGVGTNAYTNVATSPAAVGNTWRVTCKTSSGGTGVRVGTF